MVSLFFLVKFHSSYLWHIQMRGQTKTHRQIKHGHFLLSVCVRPCFAVRVRQCLLSESVRVLSVCVRQCLSVRVRPCFVCPSSSVFCLSVSVRVLFVCVRPCFVCLCPSVFVCPCVCFCLSSHLSMPQVRRVELNEEKRLTIFLF